MHSTLMHYSLNEYMDYTGGGSICLVGQASDKALVRIRSTIDTYPYTSFLFRGVAFGLKGLTFDGGADLLQLDEGQMGMDDVTIEAFGGPNSAISAMRFVASRGHI